MPISETCAHERRIACLDALPQARREDHQLYCTKVLHLPERTIAAYSRLCPRGFAAVLVTLAEHTQAELPFELCDELARFYAVVFRVAGNAALRRLALAALLALGPPHRRYAVADVVRGVLWSVRSRADVALVLAVIEQSPWTGWYAHHHTFRGPLQEQVAAALARAARRPGSQLKEGWVRAALTKDCGVNLW
jgi:hypothetical protein